MRPGLRVVGTEDAEIGFKFLIGSFGLSVGLRVVVGGKFDIVLQETSKLSCECGGKLGTMIRDNGVMETKSFEYVVKKELGDPSCINGFVTRSKNYPLSKTMVDHDQNKVKSQGRWKVGNEVNRELLEREKGGG